MYVERDSRKQVLGKVENAGQLEYLGRCVELLVSTMVDAVPRLSSTYSSQLINQPINQSVNQSINQSIDRSICYSGLSSKNYC